MNRCDEDRIQDYILEILPPDERLDLERHLTSCASCSAKSDQYRLLFLELKALPFPPVPTGIADAVLARLQPSPALAAPRRRRVAFAFGSLAMLGLLMAIFHRPVLLLFGRITGGFATGLASELVAGLREVLGRSAEVAVILHLFVDAAVKLEAVFRVLGEVLLAVPDRTIAGTLALSLATALLLGRLLGQIRKEKFGHVEY